MEFAEPFHTDCFQSQPPHEESRADGVISSVHLGTHTPCQWSRRWQRAGLSALSSEHFSESRYWFCLGQEVLPPKCCSAPQLSILPKPSSASFLSFFFLQKLLLLLMSSLFFHIVTGTNPSFKKLVKFLLGIKHCVDVMNLNCGASYWSQSV